MIWFALGWWLIGAAMFLHVCWAMEPAIRVKDLMVMLMAGLLGPFGMIYYIFYPTDISFWDRVIFRKKW